MFPNAALIRTNYAPGQYDSGGPLPHSADRWRADAPQLDFLAPDIYFEFKAWADKFVRRDNPLFIPETRGGVMGAANVFYAVGHHGAIGFCPFGIDRSDAPDAELAKSYQMLGELAPLILRHQPRGEVEGVVLGELTPSQNIQLGGYTLKVEKAGSPRVPPVAGANEVSDPHGLFIASGRDEFYVGGSGLTVTFASDQKGLSNVGLATVEEGNFVDGQWKPGRLLAGDDPGQGNNISLRGRILRVTVYRIPEAPARLSTADLPRTARWPCWGCR